MGFGPRQGAMRWCCSKDTRVQGWVAACAAAAPRDWSGSREGMGKLLEEMSRRSGSPGQSWGGDAAVSLVKACGRSQEADGRRGELRTWASPTIRACLAGWRWARRRACSENVSGGEGAAAGVLGERLRRRGLAVGAAASVLGGGRAQLRQRGVQGGCAWVKGGNNGVVRRNHGRGGENRQRR